MSTIFHQSQLSKNLYHCLKAVATSIQSSLHCEYFFSFRKSQVDSHTCTSRICFLLLVCRDRSAKYFNPEGTLFAEVVFSTSESAGAAEALSGIVLTDRCIHVSRQRHDDVSEEHDENNLSGSGSMDETTATEQVPQGTSPLAPTRAASKSQKKKGIKALVSTGLIVFHFNSMRSLLSTLPPIILQ
jgi:hypothetical protein